MISLSRTDTMLAEVVESVVRTSNITALDLLACPPNANVQLRTLQPSERSEHSIMRSSAATYVRRQALGNATLHRLERFMEVAVGTHEIRVVSLDDVYEAILAFRCHVYDAVTEVGVGVLLKN